MFKINSIFNKGDEGKPKQASSSIRIIGDRYSGKTAYMAALARWPNANANSPVQRVVANNNDGEELVRAAQNLLEQGLELQPTTLNPNPTEIKDYGIGITLKDQFSWRNMASSNNSQLIDLNISCKDYAGEFFSDLLNSQSDPVLDAYLEDCVISQGIALLVDGTSYQNDRKYASGLSKFLAGIDRFDLAGEQRRIAFVITKAEQPELVISRNDSKKAYDYAHSTRFPEVYKTLKSWQAMGAGKVDFFLVSAFGTLGSREIEGNYRLIAKMQGGTKAVIRHPQKWRPFGLIAPLYWLCTGNRHKDLDKD
jgi:hypothetical protein